MILEKSKAPGFKLKDQSGEWKTLENYAGNLLILYFYPRDNTPGCTTEACNFRDDFGIYKDLGVEIVGISTDDEESHTKFITKFDLPFTLLADGGHEVCEAYGVWAKKKNFGKEYFGIKRTTFLIDEEGMVVKVFKNVKPASHSEQVINAIEELQRK